MFHINTVVGSAANS